MANQDRQGVGAALRQVGYFCHLTMDRKHLGGILVTNQVGVPLEFKYTEPLTTTRLHKILYGASLEKYVHETLIRERLSRDIRSIPDFYIAPFEEREFLGSMAGKEMMAIQPFHSAQKESNGPFTRVRDREAIVELEDAPPLRVAFSTIDDAIQRSMATWLQEISRTMDVLEPLERIVNALNAIFGDEKKT